MPFLDLRRETQELRGELDLAHERVLRSGVFLGGEEVDAFEREFAAFCGAREAVCVRAMAPW